MLNLSERVLAQVTNPGAMAPLVDDPSDVRILCWGDPPHRPAGTNYTANEARPVTPLGLCRKHHVEILGVDPVEDDEPLEREAC